MNRNKLTSTESVADLFKVTNARTRRRIVRLGDAFDWELLVDILRAAYGAQTVTWPEEPISGLFLTFLSRRHGHDDALVLVRQMADRLGGWVQLLASEMQPLLELGISEGELGHLRTLLRFAVQRFGGVTLDPIGDMTDDRALITLSAFPGVDLAAACSVLVHSFNRPLLPPTGPVRRVLTRLGAVPADAIDAELVKAVRSIPPTVSVPLLAGGLATLAQDCCVPEQPDCAHCPLQKLCLQGRQSLKASASATGLTMVDLFAGAGGMSYGLGMAGFNASLAVELDEWAAETYRTNHPELPANHVLTGDIREMDPDLATKILGGKQPDLLVGGPPCQGFSLIGKRARAGARFIDDPRNQLYKEYIRWVAHLHPRFVVMENVPGLYSFEDGAVRDDIEMNLRELGYAVDGLVVDATRFGVPQRRQRVLFLGVSIDTYGERALPIVQRIVEQLRERNDSEVTLQDAIGDLPALEAGTGREATPSAARPSSAYAAAMNAGREGILLHHVARPINLRDKLLYGRLRPGETAEDAVAQDARHLMVYQTELFKDKYRKLKLDEPCPTIMSHLAKDGHMFIHPDPRQARSLTVREAARIQSFPDDFVFRGPRTRQYTQVGNAVPPLLARAIGESILHALAEVNQDNANHELQSVDG